MNLGVAIDSYRAIAVVPAVRLTVCSAAVAVVRALTATKRFRSKAEVDHDEFRGVKQAFDCEGLAVTMIEKDNHVRSA